MTQKNCLHFSFGCISVDFWNEWMEGSESNEIFGSASIFGVVVVLGNYVMKMRQSNPSYSRFFMSDQKSPKMQLTHLSI